MIIKIKQAALVAVFLCPLALAQGPYNLTAGVTINDPTPANTDSYDVEIYKNGAVVATTNTTIPSAALALTGDTGDNICAQARAKNFVIIGNWSAQECVVVPAAPSDLTINFTLTGG